MTSETRVQHTPGPWKVEDDNMNQATIIRDASDMEVAMIDWARAMGPFDWDEANARLIASAPDLLAALESLTQLGTDDNGAIIVGPRGWELAQAAIRRARGED